MSDLFSISTGHPWISRLAIRHFAGVQSDTSFTVEGLCPGINLIHGPNGSGKTTTARALQELLWNQQDSTDYRVMEALLHDASHTWTLQWNATRPEISPAEGAQPPRPTLDLRNRYCWSLADLLHATDGDLAAQIAKEMAGGVDFEELESRTGGTKPPPFPRKLHDQFEQATARAREILQAQATLHHRAERLKTLEEERDQLAQQHARLPLLTRLLELRAHEQERESLREQLATFPPELSAANREDAHRIDQLETGLMEVREKLQSTLQEIRIHGQGEETWALIPIEQIRQARKHLDRGIDQWRICLQEETTFRRKLEDLEVSEGELRRRLRLQDHQAEYLLENGNVPEFRNWVQLVMRDNRIQEELQALEARLEGLEPVPGDVEVLRDAQRDLLTWLAAVQPPRLASLVGFASTYVLWVVLLFVAIRHSPPGWYSLLVLPLLMEWGSLRVMGARERQGIASRFPASIPAPDTWTESAVRETLSEIERQLDAIRLSVSYEPDRQRLQLLKEQQASVKEDMQNRIGDLWDAEMDLELPPPEWLAHFLLDAQTWRDSRIQLAQAETHLEEARSVRTEQEARLLALFQEWAPLPSGVSLEEHTEDLLERFDLEREHREQLEQLRTRETLQRERLRELEQEQATLCARLGVDRDDWSGARARLQLLDAYIPLKEKFDLREQQIQEDRTACAEAGDRLERSREELATEQHQSEEAGARSRELEKEIQEIQAEIRQATRGRQLHEIREHQEDLRQQLARERDAIVYAHVVHAVVDWLRDKCRTGQRPEVLDAANTHLSRLTQGALTLTLSLDKGTEEFQAGSPGHPARPLNQLSAGERTHVLMAVRLAFLQHQETTPFPLFVDEVVGTSDEQRTQAILHTLVDIARQGRQVFVFTAQAEEVGKWREVLRNISNKEEAVPFHAVDLGALRTGSPAKPISLPEPPQISSATLIQNPGETEEEWAKRLGVPAWNPHQPLEDLPLFLLMRNQKDTLVRCLQAGIRTWGALQMLMENGASKRFLDESQSRYLIAKMEALKALVDAWRVGRPAPLDPQALIDSGTVSATLLPSVLSVLEETQGAVAPFLAALESGAVSQWGKKKTEKLKEFLQETGNLSTTEPQSIDAIRSAAMATLASEEESALLTPSDWGEMIAILEMP